MNFIGITLIIGNSGKTSESVLDKIGVNYTPTQLVFHLSNDKIDHEKMKETMTARHKGIECFLFALERSQVDPAIRSNARRLIFTTPYSLQQYLQKETDNETIKCALKNSYLYNANNLSTSPYENYIMFDRVTNVFMELSD